MLGAPCLGNGAGAGWASALAGSCPSVSSLPTPLPSPPVPTSVLGAPGEMSE